MKRILLIEDDPWQADLVKDYLLKEGMTVDVARDAISGIDRVDNHIPDLILLDIFLPGPNGLTFLHELRSFSDTGNIPVIIWTTAVSKSDSKQFERYGVVAVIDKSTIAITELIHIIKKALKK